jgi:hypothetical protein
MKVLSRGNIFCNLFSKRIISVCNTDTIFMKKSFHLKNINSKYFTTNENIDKIKEIPDLRSFLTDNFSRMHNYLRISLTERCNLRCQVSINKF